jgi:putative ABC transport system permease protein
VGSAALTIILAITSSFRGTVVGSLLGDAVTLQVRGADLAAVVGIILLGALIGAAAGLAATAELANRLPGGTISTTVIAGAGSVAVAALAGVIPIVTLRRLPPARLLAQD